MSIHINACWHKFSRMDYFTKCFVISKICDKKIHFRIKTNFVYHRRTLGHTFFNVVIVLSFINTNKTHNALILPSKITHICNITPRACINMTQCVSLWAFLCLIYIFFAYPVYSTEWKGNDDDNLDMCFVLWIYMSQVSSL